VIYLPQGRVEELDAVASQNLLGKMDVAAGLEPTKIGFAGRRLDHAK